MQVGLRVFFFNSFFKADLCLNVVNVLTTWFICALTHVTQQSYHRRIQGGVSKSDHFCGFIIADIIISLIVVILRLPKSPSILLVCLVTYKSVFLVTGGNSLVFHFPAVCFHLFIKPYLQTCKLSVSVKLSVCSNTAVSESASGRGDKWHPAPLALIERCQRSVSSCCHHRLGSAMPCVTFALRLKSDSRHSLHHFSKNFCFQDLNYLS